MNTEVRRIFVEKKTAFATEGEHLYQDLKMNLDLINLEGVRIVNRYDSSGIEDEVFKAARTTIFSEPNVDLVYDEILAIGENERAFGIEYLPGQYDQRADSAEECVVILSQDKRPIIKTAKILVLKGKLTEEEYARVKKYCINPVDSREADDEKPKSLDLKVDVPSDVKILKDFIKLNDDEITAMVLNEGYAMSPEDLKFCRDYFRDTEKRDPSITEIKVIDTYWSDHCRHTTFLTEISEIEIKDGKYSVPIKKALAAYVNTRKLVYKNTEKPMTLMDIAVIGMKELKLQGKLKDLDESEEINACSIVVDVDIDDRTEKYLVMFKNETHNHPTEIEPFGGAATCLGGAIRDPLSGRSYVYQAMRVTGSGDPTVKLEDTLPGKLSQRKITVEAAHGYSSYGNQIGLATGSVVEIYDEGYRAKRMEIGAVIAAAPESNVVRERPNPGDIIILLGGRTGRDGCGGATGSSKAHTEESILTCGAEVQKGNPPTERKIQRLFRNPQVSKMIKRCNDFGAGGVSVAIGELAEGLVIDLDKVTKKYDGLDGTELAISESQERMAVVIDKDLKDEFIAAARGENLEATIVAEVTAHKRLVMKWRGNIIVDISREFLDTNGAKQYTDICVDAPNEENNYFIQNKSNLDIKESFLSMLSDLNICSQKGLVERFDSTVGAGTVLMPFGGKYQLTPQLGMAAKLPVLFGETNTGTIMTFGYNPEISKWSPFHGAYYAIIEAAAKTAALGGDYSKIRLSLQEYFERLGKEPKRWGKPFSALLGALEASRELGIPAIGGKDSMSGSFKDMDVPPTLVAFGVSVVDVRRIVSSEFKRTSSTVVLLPVSRTEEELPNMEVFKRNMKRISGLIKSGEILSSFSLKQGGIAEAIAKMTFGNKIGFSFNDDIDFKDLFSPAYGDIILELKTDSRLTELFSGVDYIVLGKTQQQEAIVLRDTVITIEEMLKVWEKPLEKVFESKTPQKSSSLEEKLFKRNIMIVPRIGHVQPRVFIPAFPGTNCEYDSARAFEKAGAKATIGIFRNITARDIECSIEEIVKNIKNSQIIMFPGGFSAGDEPEGSGKFIATVFRNQQVSEAVMELITNRDGLILGICNGFQALIKLGLLPYGKIMDLHEECPTLTYNEIGRHISQTVNTKVVSKISPWLYETELGDVHTIPVSHGEGRFVGNEALIKQLFENGQIATQYVDFDGKPTINMPYNPNGSMFGVEGITSPDGRIFGKMGHSERIGKNVMKNIPGNKDQKLFEAGVNYFRD